MLHREANNYNKKFVHQELSPNKSPEFEVSVDLTAVAKVDQPKTELVSEISEETILPEIQNQDQEQQIIAEEDLPLETRANKKSKEISKKEEPIQQINKDYKIRGRSYYKSLFRSVDVKDFALKLSKWNRKYDKNAVDRMVLHSTVLKKAFLQLKALDIYTTFLNELKKMAATQNIKKIVKPIPANFEVKNESTKRQKPEGNDANTNNKKKPVPESDAIYAQNFFDKVEDILLTANKYEEFEKFTTILKSFDPTKDRVADLYYKLEKIFHPNYPDLLNLFLTFLQPGEAAQIGKVFEHFIVTNMSNFLQKLNVYFAKQPGQIRKIYNCLNELANVDHVTIETVKESILPLLKGNPLLIAWFQQIFLNEKPMDCNEIDSETFYVKKGNEQIDATEIYEELVLSDNVLSTDTPSCGLRYFQGNIMYSGRMCTLPAKLSFLAYETVVQYEKREQAVKNADKEVSAVSNTGCCHAIKTYADTRLQEKIKSTVEKDVNSSHSGDELEPNSVLGKELKPKREPIPGSCGTLHNIDFH